MLKNGYTVGKKFYFRQRVRSKQQRSALSGDDFFFQEAPELCCGNGVQAARRFVQEQHLWLMKQRAQQTETLNGPRRKVTHLAIKRFAQFELFPEGTNSSVQVSLGEMVQPAEELEIFSAREPGVKTSIASSVIAELVTHRRRLAHGIMAREPRGSPSWQQ